MTIEKRNEEESSLANVGDELERERERETSRAARNNYTTFAFEVKLEPQLKALARHSIVCLLGA